MIYIPVQFAYLCLSLVVAAAWGVLFWLNKQGRQRQIFFSSAFAIAGPVAELLYIPDYWHPVTILSVHISGSYISIEDFIFSFSIMGIMSSLPGLIVPSLRSSLSPRPSLLSLFQMAALLGAVAILSVILWIGGINSIFATSFSMLFSATILLIVLRDRALLRIATVGALGMPLLMFTVYWVAFFAVSDSEKILQQTWALYGTALGTRLLRVPLPELLWSLSFGGFFSILFTLDRDRLSPQRFNCGGDGKKANHPHQDRAASAL